jgi:putative lipoic acid-binding regulatory protein
MASYKDTLLEFPCDFPLKIMGKADDTLARSSSKSSPGTPRISTAPRMEMRASSGGNYLSLTCTVIATSKPQLDALYTGFHRPPDWSKWCCEPVGQTLGPGRLRADLAGDAGFHRQPPAETPDELWIVEHPPVYTLGQAGKPEHMLRISASRSSRSTAAARSPTTAPARS